MLGNGYRPEPDPPWGPCSGSTRSRSIRTIDARDAEPLRSMYRTMVTARLVDEAAFRLNRQGKAPFVVPVSGHEGCQVGTGWPLRPGQDIWVPYYRDVAIVLIAGMTPYRSEEHTSELQSR